jgi:adenylate cyclase
VLGEGVNLAARLEQMADAGGVLISGKIYEEVEGKIERQFECRGEQQVKNIARPIRVYALAGAAPSRSEPKPLPLPDKPSIAVLPFTNMSGDPEQDYFAEGITEDLITALSRVKSFFVIARNSSFTYKGRDVEVKHVGRELGVRYVLEGSVRKAGNRLRITGQLIDASTGHHIWANKFDGNLEDVFDLQDTITDAIVAAIEPSVKEAELQRSRSKSTESLQAYDLCLQALPNINWMISKREDNDKALFLLFKAIALDPSYTLGKALAAFATVLRKSQHWSTPDEEAAGIRLAEEALSSHGDHPTALACAAHALAYLGRRYDPALRAMDQALDLGRNSWRVLTSNAWVRVYCGDGEAALKSFERCMRLNPLDPEIGFSLSGVATAHLIAGRYEEAIKHGYAAMDAAPTWVTSYRAVVFALVEMGRMHEAEAVAAKLLRLAPRFSASLYRGTGTFRDTAFMDRYCAALVRAGIPE